MHSPAFLNCIWLKYVSKRNIPQSNATRTIPQTPRHHYSLFQLQHPTVRISEIGKHLFVGNSFQHRTVYSKIKTLTHIKILDMKGMGGRVGVRKRKHHSIFMPNVAVNLPHIREEIQHCPSHSH